MHVFADLEPYICTFPDCHYELVQFTTRAAWADHEFSCHRFQTRWRCPECGSEETSPQDWDRHFQGHHLGLTGPELRVAREYAQNSKARPIETEECLLCRDTPAQSRRTFIKHVGRHMEEMALFALPGDTEDDSEGPSDVSSQNSNAVGHVKLIQVDSDVKQLKDTREHLSCLLCPAIFKSKHILKKHVLSTHTRPFVCIFQRYGCHITVGSKHEWKRHINVEHLHLETWRCDLDGCAFPITSGHKKHILTTESSEFLPSKGKGKKTNLSEMQYHDFDRKDLFTQHIKRMHAPPRFASNADKAAFEAQIPIIQNRCHLQLRSPPSQSRCPYCPNKIFEGDGSWTDRLEHVGKHLEKNDIKTEDEIEDEDLRSWMMQHRLIGFTAHSGYVVTSRKKKKTGRIEKASEGEEDAEGEEEDMC